MAAVGTYSRRKELLRARRSAQPRRTRSPRSRLAALRPRWPASLSTARGRALLWFALAMPLAYVSMIFTVATHEVVGHCGALALTEGEATWLEIGLDGSGHVMHMRFQLTSEGAVESVHDKDSEILVSAGGVTATSLVGLLLLLPALLLRRHPLLATALILVAAHHLLDGPSYALQDTWEEGVGGDIESILSRPAFRGLRVPLMLGGGALLALVLTAAAHGLFRCVESVVGPLSRTAAAALAAGVAVLLLGWLVPRAIHPDRVPGAHLPLVVGTATLALTGVRLVLRRRRWLPRRPLSPTALVLSAAAAWLAVVAVVLCVTHTGLSEGIGLI